ncbi:hypothetical protein NDU88_008520 [Pleurodeles waltl]|uniref:Uncharacterized protein n=1 Tax=Pleurodeles waltl TaxID=8319 RepID=A0AAV7QPY6_PLEWA|nr:hypothetical protein NDU88_008520 [Pleurodeles waltl]
MTVVHATPFHYGAPRPATRYPGGTVDSQRTGEPSSNPDVRVKMREEDERAGEEDRRAEEGDANEDAESRVDTETPETHT